MSKKKYVLFKIRVGVRSLNFKTINPIFRILQDNLKYEKNQIIKK